MKGKSKRKWQWLFGVVFALCMLLMIPQGKAVAEETVSPTVIYLDGVNGADTNNGTTQGTAVKTLEKAYELLVAVDGGIKENAQAEGVIVLCEDVTFETGHNFNIPTKEVGGKATTTHVGKITLTSKWGEEDYTTSAALIGNKNDGLYFQLGGPTVFENMKIQVNKSHFRIYAGADFTLGEGITVTKASGAADFSIGSGFCRVNLAEEAKLTVLSGQVDYVVPVPSGESHLAAVAGADVKITIGGNATVSNVWAGAQKEKGGSSTLPEVSVTIQEQAKVNIYKASGYDGVTTTNSTLIVKGGTISGIEHGSNVTNAYIVFDGVTGSYPAPAAGTTWQGIMVQTNTTANTNSVITWTSSLSNVTTPIAVNKDNRVILYTNDTPAALTNITWTVCGKVVYGDNQEYDNHSFGNDNICDRCSYEASCMHTNATTQVTPATCTSLKVTNYSCDCGHSWSVTDTAGGYAHQFDAATGICRLCNGSRGVVYVDGSLTESGDGYNAVTAVKTLEEAYNILLNATYTDLSANQAAVGVIVVCGPVTVDGHFNYDSTLNQKGKITWTSVVGVTDYRETKNAALKIAMTASSSNEHRIVLPGATVMENLVIDRQGSKQPLTLYATDLWIKDTVETLGTNWSKAEGIEGLTDQEIESIKLSAHRGYQPIGSENTIVGFEAAGKAGFEYIESDVYWSADRKLVCMHDSTIDRTTNGSGSVSAMTWEELQQYQIDIASYGSDISNYTKEDLRIPLFSEYVKICKQYGSIPFIETKASLSSDDLLQYMREIIQVCLDAGFEEEEIVISSGSKAHMRAARQVSDKVFIHSIWAYGSAQEMINDGVYGPIGLAYNIQKLHLPEQYAAAKAKVDADHAKGAQVCLRAGDDLTQVYYMYKLGLDYIPTNLTTPAMLEQLKEGVPASYSNDSSLAQKGTSDTRIFVRGGDRNTVVADDISIVLEGGLYDMVAPSNAEKTCTGNYAVTVGGEAFVSRLVGGETGNTTEVRNTTSTIIIDDDGYVKNLYTAGDKATMAAAYVQIKGGTVESISGRRSGAGVVKDLTVTIYENGRVPNTLSISDTAMITGTKKLVYSGVTAQLDSGTKWDQLEATDNSVLTLAGTWPSTLQTSHGGKIILPGPTITITDPGEIACDASVTAGTANATILYAVSDPSIQTQVTWYADDNGVKGQALTSAPDAAGTYWINVACAQQDTDAADGYDIYYGASAEELSFVIKKHEMSKTEYKAPTYTAEGNQAYYTCSGCGNHYVDEQATQKITDLTSTVIPALVAVENTTVVVSEEAVQYAMTQSTGETVVLPVAEEMSQTATEAALPTSTLQNLAQSDKKLQLAMDEAVVTLDPAALAYVAQQANSGDMLLVKVLKIAAAEMESHLNTAQQTTMEGKTPYMIWKAVLTVGNPTQMLRGRSIPQILSDLGNGIMTVELPFQAAAGTQLKDYILYQVAADGKMTAVTMRISADSVRFDWRGDAVYVILHEPQDAPQGGGQGGSQSGSQGNNQGGTQSGGQSSSGSDNSQGTAGSAGAQGSGNQVASGDTARPMLWMALIVISVIGLVVVRKKIVR